MSSQELSKVYDPKLVEEKWLERWNEANLFRADPKAEGEAFSIVIPPPNVTGVLHMGHALNNTLQDILTRYQRMRGANVLWVPGTDHAGIATQNVVERELKKEGKKRQDLGREKFIERVWEWKEKSGNHIVRQLKRLGASCDWSRERFTMDEGLSHAVREAFVHLYEKGLIFRDKYLINWCPRCLTALSDIEVEHQEQNGSLWFIKYPLSHQGGEGQGEGVTVATTRPETLLGDTAVAVHPQDERYQKIVGTKVRLPLTGREIPVIADHRVDREFGTGAVKVTPAHDFNDFAFGNDHKLPRINIFTEDGKVNENGLHFQGLDRFEARKQIVAELEEKGFLVKTEPHKLSVGQCYRCKTVVEPYLSLQWFVKTKPLAERALQAVRDGKTKFHPENWTRTYENWMENIKDWCISRQIWWGHRIPAWYCECLPMEPIVSREDPKQCPKCSSKNLRQEEDVLDTWFSSGLWPFSTLGWPKQTEELKKYYPTSVLVTAHDIIFFWVARMMMFGLEMMDEVPFKDVYIHALVRDAQGQKMSKSKGNVIDPLVIMDQFGTDAFRFTLAALAAQGRDIKLSEQTIEGNRNFANKIWNASRFALMNIGNFDPSAKPTKMESAYDHWIRYRLRETVGEVSQAIEAYEFDVAARALYRFFWNDFCDWYLEFSKLDLNPHTLLEVLSASLALLHPFMPFITEEIGHILPGRESSPSVAQWPFPTPETVFPHELIKAFGADITSVDRMIPVVAAIRSVRGENRISPAVQLKTIVAIADPEEMRRFESQKSVIEKLARLSELTLQKDRPSPRGMAHVVIRDGVEVFVPLEGLVDFAAEIARLDKEIKRLEDESERRTKRLEDANFVSRADPEFVEEEKASLREGRLKLEKLKATRVNFQVS